MAEIHATAIVHPKASIGADVSIGPYTTIDADVVIGDGCRIGPRVSVLAYTELGAGCAVHANAVLGDLPQDLAFKGGRSYLRVGCNTTLREGVTLHRGTETDSATRIGSGCFLMGHTHVAHNVTIGDGVITVNGVLIGGHARVDDRAFLSGNAMVHQFVHIGRLAMLGGGAGITKDVPPFCTTKPAGYNDVVGVNLVGLKRAGVAPADRAAVRMAFRILFREGLAVPAAVARIRAETDSALAEEMCAFAEASARGICGQ